MSFLQSSTRQFHHHKDLAEKALAQLHDAALQQDAAEENGNSLVVIIKHMRGNMLSRWTNFLTEDGEKEWRKREEEFEHESLSRESLMALWEEGWSCVFSTLASLTDEDLSRTIHIRKEAMSAMDGIIRQLMHYAYHVGQIILLCKQEVTEGWSSLSIPPGGTAAFNTSMAAHAERNKYK